MPKMYHGGKTRRHNRRKSMRGGGVWDSITSGWNYLTNTTKDGFKIIGTDVESSVNSAKDGLMSFTDKNSQAQPYPQVQSYPEPSYPSMQQPPQQPSMGGRRRKKRGGFQAYYPADTWNSMSPYPSAVGGTRRRCGGFQAYYPPDTWTSMYPYPAAVGGKKCRTCRTAAGRKKCSTHRRR